MTQNQAIALGGLSALGLALMVGAGTGGVTPSPTQMNVAPPLTKTGTLVGLMRCPAGQTPVPNANDAGYSCRLVLTELSGDDIVSAGCNSTTGVCTVSASVAECGLTGQGYFYDLSNDRIACIADPSHGPLATSMSADAGLAVYSLSTNHVESTTFGHIYTDAGIVANSVNTNSLQVGAAGTVYSRIVTAQVNIPASNQGAGSCSILTGASVPNLKDNAPCFASGNRYTSYNTGTVLNCYALNQVAYIEVCCVKPSGFCTWTAPDVGDALISVTAFVN